MRPLTFMLTFQTPDAISLKVFIWLIFFDFFYVIYAHFSVMENINL